MPQDLNTRIVIRMEDRTRTGVQSTRKGIATVGDTLKRLSSHATSALSSLILVGGIFEGLRRGAGAAVRAYADVETGLVGVAKTAHPRSRGEHLSRSILTTGYRGSSPLARGTLRTAGYVQAGDLRDPRYVPLTGQVE